MGGLPPLRRRRHRRHTLQVEVGLSNRGRRGGPPRGRRRGRPRPQDEPIRRENLSLGWVSVFLADDNKRTFCQKSFSVLRQTKVYIYICLCGKLDQNYGHSVPILYIKRMMEIPPIDPALNLTLLLTPFGNI